MDATTMRASTVIRSMPTSDTRTQASTTMPLSRTRSRTSMRLVPPGARSTGGMRWVHLFPAQVGGGVGDGGGGAWGGGELALELGDAALQARQGAVRVRCATQGRVVAPPVEADLLGLVDGADQQADADGEQLDVGQG